jgi:hypothetical protein
VYEMCMRDLQGWRYGTGFEQQKTLQKLFMHQLWSIISQWICHSKFAQVLQ